nr:cytochrome P450 82C4-like [Ipomoea batatas]
MSGPLPRVPFVSSGESRKDCFTTNKRPLRRPPELCPGVYLGYDNAPPGLPQRRVLAKDGKRVVVELLPHKARQVETPLDLEMNFRETTLPFGFHEERKVEVDMEEWIGVKDFMTPPEVQLGGRVPVPGYFICWTRRLCPAPNEESFPRNGQCFKNAARDCVSKNGMDKWALLLNQKLTKRILEKIKNQSGQGDGWRVPTLDNLLFGEVGIHRDPKYGPRPKKFKPERFLLSRAQTAGSAIRVDAVLGWGEDRSGIWDALRWALHKFRGFFFKASISPRPLDIPGHSEGPGITMQGQTIKALLSPPCPPRSMGRD